MTPLGWTGAGLPPIAAARVAEAAARGTWTSALGVKEFAALEAAGFEPAGQVMGSAVYYFGNRFGYGYHDCGYSTGVFGSGGRYAGVALSSAGAPSSRLVMLQSQARNSAVERMRRECEALGGDGVIGASLRIGSFPSEGCIEFQVIGTAVRARGPVRTRHPFTTHLRGNDVAKLLTAGWVPVSVVFGMSVGVRHDDWSLQAQRMSWSNQEIAGWSELVHTVRTDARRVAATAVTAVGGDGLVLERTPSLSLFPTVCPRSANAEIVDHIAESDVVGTAVARFARIPDVDDRLLSGAHTLPGGLAVLPLGKV